jgi:hypothetical protein
MEYESFKFSSEHAIESSSSKEHKFRIVKEVKFNKLRSSDLKRSEMPGGFRSSRSDMTREGPNRLLYEHS